MVNDPILIMQATVRDLEQLAPVFDQYRVFYKQASDLEAAKQFLFEKFEHRESVIFLAKHRPTDQIVGFTQLYPSFSSISLQRTWILNDLFVCADYRKQGIATKLLNQAKEFAALTKAKGLELSTATDNAAAQKCYEGLGYQRDDGFFHYFLKV